MFLLNTIDKPDSVQAALRQASRSTGADFEYLLNTAQRESNLDPGARAPTSSASGLFQFIESTWLATLKEAGPRHGYDALASRIERTSGGEYEIADQRAREEILALRHDPKAAALMAGELTRQNGEALRLALGREPSPGELYLAHFLGARGASELIQLARTAPETSAASRFEAAASANRAIFYAQDGTPRGAGEVYARLVGPHDDSSDAIRGGQGGPGHAPAREDAGPVFHGLFTDRGNGLGPIGRAVASQWSGFAGPSAARSD